MRQTIFMIGPSNIEGQSTTRIETEESGRIKGSANWRGNLHILPLVTGDPSLKSKSIFALAGIQQVKVTGGGKPNLFNMVAEADASNVILNEIQALGREIQPKRFFNEPINVQKTSRQRLPQTLRDISRCRLPRTLYSEPKSFSELQLACKKFDKWPLIIRATGYHSGENMVLLESFSQLDSIEGEDWLYSGIFLIEFIDYKDDHNIYTKNRVVMVDGVPYVRHSIRSDRPIIHSKNRADLMDENDGLCLKEKQFLIYMRDAGLEEYRDVFDSIYKRIGLDIFGIDFALVDGQVIVFEANACMNFLNQDYGKNDRYRYLEIHVRALRRAVKKMLMTA